MLDCSLILACVRLHCGHLAEHLAVSRRRLADLLVTPVSRRRLASRLHTAPILGTRWPCHGYSRLCMHTLYALRLALTANGVLLSRFAASNVWSLEICVSLFRLALETSV